MNKEEDKEVLKFAETMSVKQLLFFVFAMRLGNIPKITPLEEVLDSLKEIKKRVI